MIYLHAFIFCGIVCLIGQLIIDNTKLTAGHVTTLFVVIGAFLDIFSFGHSLIHGALVKANEFGLIGLAMGMFDLTAPGIISSIVFSFILSFIFIPKD